MNCNECNKPSAFGRYYKDQHGKDQFTCSTCRDRTITIAREMLSGKRDSAMAIIAKKHATWQYKVEVWLTKILRKFGVPE